ncbi:phosphate signaling complex PhoU family protein [Deinococcus radiophilus]|uniref:Phosphate uptake regulator PhoU n=2 Tax=Deinococcus radiophilus TaxID=32062 RepID=A0A431VS32_9DEIO|nr:phosphate uptake regulator PhoU [Deinococcus radiophilus]RTR25913.1 phosphate uptake regulator PhoU [Deinococcus radiophilus]UFA49705.1 phosphate uptake regulator PhoU [Deinococcus radiophilus]
MLPSSRTTLLTAGLLRMISIALEQLEAVRGASERAEFAGLAETANRLEAETDLLEREIEEQCLQGFAQPSGEVACGFYVMVFRSLTHLERVGDYAFRVATDLEHLAPRTRSATLQDVLPITQHLSEMLELLAYAISERDLAAAQRVQRLDFEQVDALYEQMLRASLTRLRERPEDHEVALAANRMARNLERLGDHIGHVAARLERHLLAGEAKRGKSLRRAN